MKAVALLVVASMSIACPAAKAPKENPTMTTTPASIGSATMLADGTIVMNLRAEGPGGAVGDAQLRYPTTHKDYAKILAHLGGLKPGESKPVPPFPDEK